VFVKIHMDCAAADNEKGRERVTLDQMIPGNECLIKKLSIKDKLGQRLMDMGVYPGRKLKVIRNAPLEDPMEIEVDGYFVSLRHDEARFIEVERHEAR
jgi:ferrous iron transport protein A